MSNISDNLSGKYILPAFHDYAAGRPSFFTATKIRIGRDPMLRQGQVPRLCCRRAVLRCGDDGAASIPKSGLEIKNRCTQEGVPAGFPELAESLHRKKRAPHLCERLSAVRTRLELATPGVTGRYSNRLNYRTSPNSLERECKDSDFFRFSNSEDIFFKKYLLCLRLEFNIYESTKKL